MIESPTLRKGTLDSVGLRTCTHLGEKEHILQKASVRSVKSSEPSTHLSHSKVGEGLAGEHGGGHHTAEGEHGQTTVLQLLCP